jgi:hypothetical protein
MICQDVRLLIGADPDSAGRDLEEHLRGCSGCREFHEEMRRLNADIRRALAEPPEMRTVRPQRSTSAWREYALAASVVLALAVTFGVWLLRPTDSLAREVVAHVQGEPNSWQSTLKVSPGALDHALSNSGIGLDVTSGSIVYAQSCWFRGHYVPHLVVQTNQGPVTVLILRHEHVSAPDDFHEDGMTGVIVPAGDGSVAVLSRGKTRVDAVAGQLRQQVHWLPEPTAR